MEKEMGVRFLNYLSIVSEVFISLSAWANSSAMAADINLQCHWS